MIRDAVEHGRRHNWIERGVVVASCACAKFAHFAALGFLIGVCVGLANRGGAHVQFGLVAVRQRP